LFGLKWGDIDFAQKTMNVTRSTVYGVVGPCKTESWQKPVPVHPLLTDDLLEWRKRWALKKADDWFFASSRSRGRKPYWGQAICANMFDRSPRGLEFRKVSAGTRFVTMPNAA
jgi:integrase